MQEPAIKTCRSFITSGLLSRREGEYASVSIRDVLKSFGPNAVLHGDRFRDPEREFVVLVGPSGCASLLCCGMNPPC